MSFIYRGLKADLQRHIVTGEEIERQLVRIQQQNPRIAVIQDRPTENGLIPILEQVKENSPAYSEAYRLRKFLQYFESVPDDDLPPTSLLREFLGGSSFKY